MVATELDVGGNEVAYFRIGAAKHDVLSGAFQIVVDDLERAGSVPSADGLRIGADFVALGYPGIDDCSARAVERDAPPHAGGGISMDITTIDYYVVRQFRHIAFIALAQPDQICDMNAGRRRELESRQPKVIR